MTGERYIPAPSELCPLCPLLAVCIAISEKRGECTHEAVCLTHSNEMYVDTLSLSLPTEDGPNIYKVYCPNGGPLESSLNVLQNGG